MVADGHYLMPRYLEIRTDNVTLRGESGKRERVVIDGGQIAVGLNRIAFQSYLRHDAPLLE